MGRTSCDVCERVYGAKKRPTPCSQCKPELKNCNVPYFTLYNYCSDQWIVGVNGPISLNMLAINQAMDDFMVDLDERRDFSVKVRKIASIIAQAHREEARAKSQQKDLHHGN